MRATQPSAICAACGTVNAVSAPVCVMCGSVLPAADMVGDPLANIVAGAPVPRHRRDLREGISETGDRLAALLPEVAAILSERMSRLSGLPLDPRLARRYRPGPYRPLRGSRLPVPAPLPLPPVPIPARAVWFVFAGSWLACLWVVATWLVLCTVIGRTVAARMLDLMPSVLTLRPATAAVQRWQALGPASPPMLSGASGVRVAYFLLVGWWASLVWMILAYVISLTAVGIPVGNRMFALTPAIAYLQQG